MVGVTIKTDGIERALNAYVHGLHEAAQDGLRAATEAAKASALLAIKAQTKRRTGELEDSFNEIWLSPFVRKLSNVSGHAKFIDEGTRPHRIPKSTSFGKLLVFEWGGRTRFFRFVKHPGTTARPFVALAMASGQMALRAAMQQSVDRLAQRF